MPYVGRVTFTESNDARPAYIAAGISVALLLLDKMLLQASEFHSKGIYEAAAYIALFACICGVNCALGCIWHPIPKPRRADGQLTTLHLSDPAKAETVESPPVLFHFLEESTAADSDETVDSSQVELRDPIQWLKLAMVVACISFNLALIILLGH